MEKVKKVFIVAGEASGDMHAAALVKEIKTQLPGVQFFGLGGPKMQAAGVTVQADLLQIAVVGFVEVLRHLTTFRRIFAEALRELERQKPDLAILVDYPGFNLRLAIELKKRNIPVIYYISPQVWAWGKKRIALIKKVVTQMLVVFRFEEDLYRSYGVPAAFVGHPLVDTLKPAPLTGLSQFKSPPVLHGGLTFALLPGSRQKEVALLLPIMLETCRRIQQEMPEARFLILRSSTVSSALFDRLMAESKLPAYLLTDQTYDGLAASDFALVASGTATLETALLGVPMVILYKTSFLTWLAAKMLIRIPYIGLVNVVAGKKIVEEFIQYQADPDRISGAILSVVRDRERISQLKRELAIVRELLGAPGASQRAAELVVNFLA